MRFVGGYSCNSSRISASAASIPDLEDISLRGRWSNAQYQAQEEILFQGMHSFLRPFVVMAGHYYRSPCIWSLLTRWLANASPVVNREEVLSLLFQLRMSHISGKGGLSGNVY